MLQTKKKIFIFALLLLVLAVVAVIIFNNKNLNVRTITPKNSVANLSGAPDKPLISTKNITEANMQDAPSNIAPITASSSAIYKDWLKNHGYMNSVGENYDSYDYETLKTLAQNGDEYAVQKLGQMIFREQGAKEAIKFYHESAVRGSTIALYGLNLVLLASDYSNAQTPELKKIVAIEISAVNNVAAMRGDRYPSVYGGAGKRAFKMDKIPLNEADNQQVKKRAEEIYNDLQKERSNLGLGLFDNSVPDEVTQQFDNMEKVFNDYNDKNK